MSSQTKEERKTLFKELVSLLEEQYLPEDAEYPHAMVAFITTHPDGDVGMAQRTSSDKNFKKLKGLFR